MRNIYPTYFSQGLIENDLNDPLKGRLYFDTGYLKLQCVKYRKMIRRCGIRIHS